MAQIRQSSDPDVASLPRDRYDIVTKDALHQFPEDILRTVLGHTNFQSSGTPPLQWAIECNQRTKSLSLPPEIRSNLLVSQWVLSGLIHPHPAIGRFLSEAVMQESSVYQHLAEERYQQGIQQGARQMSIENTLTILTERFPNADAAAVKPLLDAIEDLNRLRQLNRNALIAESFHAFREGLEA